MAEPKKRMSPEEIDKYLDILIKATGLILLAFMLITMVGGREINYILLGIPAIMMKLDIKELGIDLIGKRKK